MKFLGIVLGCLLVCFTAQADFLTGALNMAVMKANREKATQKMVDDIVEKVIKEKEEQAVLAEKYADELMNAGEELALNAALHQKDLNYQESEVKLPCGADLFAMKSGVVTLVMGDKCDAAVPVRDVQKYLEHKGNGKVYCEQNVCQIEYSQKE